MTARQQLPSETALAQALLAVSEKLRQALTAADWMTLKQIEPRARALAEKGLSGGCPSDEVLAALRTLEQLYRKIVSEGVAERERARKKLCGIQDKHTAISSYQTTWNM
ncbi:MAG: hypothetical protein KAG53_02335 [Endozoicomonadaceae bacterium]|nr:hypothetical protein [Endozoicomonadaceae bacterium]